MCLVSLITKRLTSGGVVRCASYLLATEDTEYTEALGVANQGAEYDQPFSVFPVPSVAEILVQDRSPPYGCGVAGVRARRQQRFVRAGLPPQRLPSGVRGAYRSGGAGIIQSAYGAHGAH